MTQTVVIENVLWVGPYGGAVFNALTMSGRKYRFLAASSILPRVPVAGELWAISGTIKKHPEYGDQVQIETALLEKPSGKLIVSTISKSKDFPGIGKARAENLWNEFGEAIYDLLETENYQAFSSFLGNDLATVLINGWKKLSIEADVYRYLDQRGLPFGISCKLIAIYGNQVISKIEDNPYRLLAFTSWKQADLVAKAIGISLSDERRLIAAADAVVYQRIQLNHTTTNATDFRSRVQRLLRCDLKVAKNAIDLALNDCAIVKQENSLQGLGPATMEKFIASFICDAMTGKFETDQPTLRTKSCEDISSLISKFESRERIKLNLAQQEAVQLALEAPVGIITGGAGVGKTTVLKAVHELSERLGGHIHQMALAGRAAKRMTEATGRHATTIMSFIQSIDAEKIKLDTEPLIIIDEASMIDLPTMYRILRRFEPGCRLVLVGDPAQLPPIGFGLVFHALCKSDRIPRVELTQVHRQAASTGIPQICASIRKGVVPQLTAYKGCCQGVSFIDCDTYSIANTALDVTNDLGGIHECQIVGAVKNGPAGTKTINRLFHSLLSPARLKRFHFAEGEPVIWTVNDYDLGLMNGTLGIIRKAAESLEVEFDGEVKQIPDESVKGIDYAYAITCHKSQGSQFKRVIIPVVESKILDRTLLYTAITRAQEQVVLIGDRRAFERAITSLPNPDTRETGLSDLLASLLQPNTNSNSTRVVDP